MSSVMKLKELKEISGSNAKKEYVEENKQDKLFLEMLKFLLNPYVTTGISTQKMKKKKFSELIEVENIPENIEEMMLYLEKNNTGKDEDIKVVQEFLLSYPEEEQAILKGLFTKKLTLGMGAKSVNKVLAGYIPEFSPMLAKKFEESKQVTKMITEGFTITEKLDGIRCLAIVSGGSVKLCSRQGKEFVGMEELISDYSNIPEGVYDGELLAFAETGEATEDLFRRTLASVNSNKTTTGVEHILFDYIPLSDFMEGMSPLTYTERRALLETSLPANKKLVRVLNTIYTGEEKGQIISLLDKLSSEGKEGIMINFNSSPYECKRSKGLLKAKKFDSADLWVTGVKEGEGKYVGMLGTAIVDYKGRPLEIGSGFTDDERKDLWANPEKIVNHIVEVAFQNESQTKDGKYSLRFATFKGIREDKAKEDVRYSDSDK